MNLLDFGVAIAVAFLDMFAPKWYQSMHKGKLSLYLGVHPSKNISKVFYFGGSCLIATRSAVSSPLWKSLLTEVLKMRQNRIMTLKSKHHYF